MSIMRSEERMLGRYIQNSNFNHIINYQSTFIKFKYHQRANILLIPRIRKLLNIMEYFFVAMIMVCVSAPMTNGMAALAFDLRRTAWSAVAAQYALDPYLLYAIALVESNQDTEGGIAPSPYAMATGERSYYPKDRNEAAQILRTVLASGQNVAVGMMQISVKDHKGRVTDPQDLLDPFQNLRFGASVLDEGLRTSHPELAVRIGRYNAWQRDDVARAYGQKVLIVCERLLGLARSSGARVRWSMCEGAERPPSNRKVTRR
jgi:hypothetical protein